MTDHSHTVAARPDPESRAWSNTAMILAACGVVGTTHYLGAAWLAAPVLGLPLGFFAIPLVYAGIRWGEHIRFERLSAHLRNARGHVVESIRATLARPYLYSGGFGGGPAATPAAHDPDEADHGAVATRMPELANRAPRPSSRERAEPRIGVIADLKPLLEPHARFAAWIEVHSAADTEALARAHNLDAVIRTHEGSLQIVSTGEFDSPDWSAPSPLTYAGVFPARIDPPKAKFLQANLSDALTAELVAALGEAAAASSYAASAGSSGPGARVGLARTRAEDSMIRLRDLVIRTALRGGSSEPAQAAARAVSAWLTTWDGDLEASDRLDAFDASLRLAPNDPAVALRAAAGRFAAQQEALGFEAARQAMSAITPVEEAFAQLPFVQSELELGSASDPMILGRVAAGLCLCSALVTAASRPHLQDDVLDDMRYSPWMVGRDDERVMLMRVLREISRVSPAEASAAGETPRNGDDAKSAESASTEAPSRTTRSGRSRTATKRAKAA